MIRSKAPRLTLVLLMALSLGGCLQPVNAPSLGGGPSVSAELAQISVERVDGYLGYQLKSELDYLLTGGNAPARGTRYLLKIKTQQSAASTVIDAATGRAQSASLQVEAVYLLTDQSQGGRIKASGKTFASATFDRSQLRYATLRAQRDAEERVAKSLAERLKIIITSALLADGGAAGAGKSPALSEPIIPDEQPARDPGDES